MTKLKVEKGDKYGRLKVVEEVARRLTPNGNKKRIILCKCSCGNYKDIRLENLQAGTTISCGCYNQELRIGRTTHGKCSSREYSSWAGMKGRCLNKNNPRFDSYGGRGIKVCKRWLKFDNFFEDMGTKPMKKSLDRIDNDGNYCKKNCRWATHEEQANNTRRNIHIFFKGETKTLLQWAKELQIEKSTLYTRLHRGWSVERAFFTK